MFEFGGTADFFNEDFQRLGRLDPAVVDVTAFDKRPEARR